MMRLSSCQAEDERLHPENAADFPFPLSKSIHNAILTGAQMLQANAVGPRHAGSLSLMLMMFDMFNEYLGVLSLEDSDEPVRFHPSARPPSPSWGGYR